MPPLTSTPTLAKVFIMHSSSLILLEIAIILIVARTSSLVERIGQPAVLGELIAGIVLGNLYLLNVDFFEAIKHNEIITFLAELGVVILLFQIGLESNFEKMRSVGLRAFFVAVIGVLLPFIFGVYIIGYWLMRDAGLYTHLFIGAALTATSVGITARVLQELHQLQTKEARIIISAAVIDDVLGLIILAILTAMITTGKISGLEISFIASKAIIFLIASIFVGQLLAAKIGRLFSRIHTGVGMKFTMAITFCLSFAYLASAVGLEPIVGAFAAGLMLDPVHFSVFKDSNVVRDVRRAIHDFYPPQKQQVLTTLNHHIEHHVEDLIAPIGLFLIPIFFVTTGMSVSLEMLFDKSVLMLALVMTIVAIIGKVLAGFAAGDANKYIVGFGMVPRGEVGIIFAIIGKNMGVITDEVFSAIIIMVMLTTLLTPPILTFLIKRNKDKQGTVATSIVK